MENKRLMGYRKLILAVVTFLAIVGFGFYAISEAQTEVAKEAIWAMVALFSAFAVGNGAEHLSGFRK